MTLTVEHFKKRNKKNMIKSLVYKLGVLGVGLLALTSCNDYLDKLPDDRAELNSKEKITQLLISAYPSVTNNLIHEMLSDNVDDNGRSYSSPILCEELYRFKDPTEESSDSPYDIWEGFYHSVAVCNQALEAINELGNPSSMIGDVAEAKIVRAYSMFQLANTFCMAWDPTKADEYLGLPYPLIPEQDINTKYERGTLRQLYEAINKDIEEALPNINEANARYKQPKYHFNTKAAYAFAARFNLYYMQYDKAVKYASEVLGDNPVAMLRDYEPYRNLGRQDFGNQWIRSDQDCNLILINSYTRSCRYLASSGTNARFNHNQTMASYETYWVEGPWGNGSSKNSIIYANKLYGTNQCVAYPSYDEQFEYTDKVAGIGFAHAVDPVFTGDLTILERAEAYALLGQLNNAVNDINTWLSTHCKDKVEDGTIVAPAPAPLTVASITSFIADSKNGLDYAKRTPDSWRDRSMRKHMHPQGFTVAAGDMENVLQMILHLKRIESQCHGLRFMDLKRYGIEFTHLVKGEDPLVFIAGDLRGAVQLPNTVIKAGLPGNARMTKEQIDAYIESTKSEYINPDDDE